MAAIEPFSRIGVTLDLILKTLIATPDFNSQNVKNWEAIARLIPGTNANQCARRYEELMVTLGIPLQQTGKGFIAPAVSTLTSLSGSENNTHVSSRSDSNKSKEIKDCQDQPGGLGGMGGADGGEQGPMMVIHVCDEAKNLKKDFYCPRDLLIKEMKYFAEYLSTDTQRCEEVDISVHCDVQIFDWLIKYVKRGTKEVVEPPILEANNVVSILISSDFLKMDTLVQECVKYCHQSMTAIVNTNCNMNCINDHLITRISDLFSHNEADDIKDRKDKFKSKIFAKKLEFLFSPDCSSPDSPENAYTLFRCTICKRLLTVNLEKKVRCMPSRMTIDRWGRLTYSHVRDPTFDVNKYLLELKLHLKQWRDVYWRIWGTINVLTCSRCGDVFPVTEFGHCRYHPEPPQFDNNEPGNPVSCVGTYPCCHLRTLRFDPLYLNKGCQVKDHIVNVSNTLSGGDDPGMYKSSMIRVFNDLLVRRDSICLPFQRLSDISDMEVNVFSNETFASHSQSNGTAVPALISISQEDKKMAEALLGRAQPILQSLTVEHEVSADDDEFGGSDDEVGDDESQQSSGKKTKNIRKSQPQAILLHAPIFEQTKKCTWDVQRSMRYNQDAQRQEDQRRMKEIRMYLAKLRLNPDKVDKPKKEYAGGIYSKLEAQWRVAQMALSTKQAASQFRAKPKPPVSVRGSQV